MNNYVKPIVIMKEDMFEGVYAASGDEMTAEMYWTNQDTGSLSCVHGYINVPSSLNKQSVKVEISFIGNGNISWDEFSGPAGLGQDSISINGKTVSFTVTNNGNPVSGTLGFSFNRLIFDRNWLNQDVGSGAYYRTDVSGGSLAEATGVSCIDGEFCAFTITLS